MVQTIRKYPAYKDSGVEWLGEIPEHWKKVKLNRVVFFQEGPGLRNWQFKDEGIKVICVTNITPPSIDFSKMTKYISINEYNSKYLHFTVDRGDILLASSGASWGKVSIYNSNEKVILNTSTIRLRTIDEDKIENNIIRHILASKYINLQIENLITGSCQPNFGPTHLNKIFIVLPPIAEQTAIANFLDTKTTQIENAIAIKQKQIELLKERRQILIHRAVTRGLNPDVKLKVSGVEWIGEIPEHWEVKKMKYVLNINNGSDYKHIQTDTGYPVIGSGGQFAYASEYMYDGEVVFLGRKGTIDKPLYFNGKFWAVDTMFYALPKANNNVKFLFFVSTTIPFKLYSTSTALPSMTQSDLNNHVIALPSIDEQQLIVSYIENIDRKISTAISLKEKEIEKLKEYKSVLINEAVSGKIKVN